MAFKSPDKVTEAGIETGVKKAGVTPSGGGATGGADGADGARGGDGVVLGGSRPTA
jgi:hypothetical protein